MALERCPPDEPQTFSQDEDNREAVERYRCVRVEASAANDQFNGSGKTVAAAESKKNHRLSTREVFAEGRRLGHSPLVAEARISLLPTISAFSPWLRIIVLCVVLVLAG